ncbi:sugar phosphate nucleotidyltransferase [Bacillus sp. Marseille-P3800]|uniref:sugar phosphate nucleotidyltransferase n=1 Tax=Bacillus sp. Marseille-P3800 TaxID=2014782 RepID=UPI000C06D13C|nr:sugar phosphate nucleotidyltransferase [Bacillus sp. Marseille-P3800]
MNLVLLSGGSGKRLWPLSNDSRSKQFLRLLDGDNQNRVSMVERVWEQIEKNGFSEKTSIATNFSQVDMLRKQIKGNVNFIIEPTRKDTFPAIALATLYLYETLHFKEDEVVAILPVDPYVEDKFFSQLNDLEKLLKNNDFNIGLIGINPTFPSSKYGYILPNENVKNKVNSFVEKPDEQTASSIIKKGGMWNSGVFAFKIKYLLDYLKENQYPLTYNDFLNAYDSMPKISFDYEVVEKEENIGYIKYHSYWKDLGTWNTLSEEMADDVFGNVIKQDVKSTHIINELAIPVIAIDIEDLIIATSPDGILISSKKESPKIKDLLDGVSDKPMYEEKLWGDCKVLDIVNDDVTNSSVVTKKLNIKNDIYRAGKGVDQGNYTIYVLEGTGFLNQEGKNEIMIKSGDTINIENIEFSIAPLSELYIIEICKQNFEAVVNK